MKRIMALMTGLVLLTGCTIGSLRITPEKAAQSESTTQQQEQRILRVYDPDSLLIEALNLYAQEQQVQIVHTDAEQAALAVTYQLPTEATSMDLSQGNGLLPVAAGVSSEDVCYGIPFGTNSYGYLVDNRLLKALLGEAFDQQNLKNCSWEEWQAFVQAVNDWITEPTAKKITLNGKSYQFAKAKNESTEQLQGVVTFSGANAYAGPLLTPVMATQYQTVEQVREMEQEDTEQLSGALQRLVQVVKMETAVMAGPEGRLSQQDALTLTAEQARQIFAEGKALFYRTGASETHLMEESLQQNLVLIPMKFPFTAEDLGDGYSLEELLNQPVTVADGWFTVSANAEAKAQKEAQAFLLWVYTNESGKELLPVKDETVQGLPDLSTGLKKGTRQGVEEQVKTLIGAE